MLGIRGEVALPQPLGRVKYVALLVFVAAYFLLGVRALAIVIIYFVFKSQAAANGTAQGSDQGHPSGTTGRR